MYATFEYLNKLGTHVQKYKNFKHKLLNDKDFNKYAGYETNQKERLQKKITRALEILDG
jgi:hypothetical protein